MCRLTGFDLAAIPQNITNIFSCLVVYNPVKLTTSCEVKWCFPLKSNWIFSALSKQECSLSRGVNYDLYLFKLHSLKQNYAESSSPNLKQQLHDIVQDLNNLVYPVQNLIRGWVGLEIILLTFFAITDWETNYCQIMRLHLNKCAQFWCQICEALNELSNLTTKSY